MGAQEVIRYVQTASRKTPVKAYLNVTGPIKFKDNKVFGGGNNLVVFGDYESITPVLEAEAGKTIEIEIKTAARHSAVPLLDIKKINTRIGPSAIIRNQMSIDNNAVIMMGAIINIGTVIGKNTIIDIGAVLGGRATVGKNCHIGAGAVLTDVIESTSAKLATVEDDILIGANIVIVEGVHIGKDVVVAAGAVVLGDVSAGTVVGGIPARILKINDDQTKENTALVAVLREL